MFWEEFNNSLHAPTKLVPLSHRNVLTLPLSEIKQRKLFINASAVKSSSISMCTALLDKHVKIKPYLFIFVLRSCTLYGPKTSHPL